MVEQTTVETPEVKTEPVVEVKPEVDLITRVSQVKAEEKKEPEEKFNTNDLETAIEAIPDPKLKEHMLGLKKSLLKGENQKYQEIAALRKQYEQKLAETSNWTPERLQQELNKPDFVQAAQTVLKSSNPPDSGVSDEKWSSLSEAEKAELSQLKQKISSLEQGNWEAVKAQQDTQLKNKYVNYAPDIIDTLTTKLMRNEVKATREDLWKVIDYENAVRRAYELGKTDKLTENKEKVNGMSFDTGRNMSTPNTIERQKGETIQDFMKRSYTEHTKKT